MTTATNPASSAPSNLPSSAPSSAPERTGPDIPALVVLAGCTVALMTFGPRSAFGLFQLDMLADRGWDRSTFGLAVALQNLMWGAGQPFFGAIADKHGTWRVLALSAVLYASGLYLTAVADAPIWLHVGGGVLVGLGIAAGSFSIVMAAFARRVPPEARVIVFGMGTAAGSAGMFVFTPLAQGLIDAYGWSDALVVLSAIMLLIPLVALPLRGDPRGNAGAAVEFEQSIAEALREALRSQSYLLLTAGFFVCGFQVAFITAHFPAYIGDKGLAPVWAVWGLMLIGFFNIIGSLASGLIGQRYSKPYFLALIYLGRSALVTWFLLVPISPTTVIVFAALMGLLWLSTVAPTNALVATFFGTRYLGMLGGLVFFSHQIGSFLGVWLGGVLYDRTGSYDVVWWLGVGLGLFAAVVHWPIREEAVVRPAPGTA